MVKEEWLMKFSVTVDLMVGCNWNQLLRAASISAIGLPKLVINQHSAGCLDAVLVALQGPRHI